MHGDHFVPALGHHLLTPLYDPIIRLTTRERLFRSRLLDQAEVEAGMRVLDLGSGTGSLAVLAKQRAPGADVVGLDADPQVIARARAKAEAAGVAIQFDQGMASELPYPEASFDRVLSTLFFHHLTRADKQRTLKEVVRVLKPEGRLHLADWGRPPDPLMRALSSSIRRLDGSEQTDDNLHGRLPGLLAAAGFQTVEGRGSLRTVYGTLALLSAERPV